VIRHRDLLTESLAALRAEACRPQLPRRFRCSLEQDAPDRLDILGSSERERRANR
jgi:hypothetical protein